MIRWAIFLYYISDILFWLDFNNTNVIYAVVGVIISSVDRGPGGIYGPKSFLNAASQ